MSLASSEAPIFPRTTASPEAKSLSNAAENAIIPGLELCSFPMHKVSTSEVADLPSQDRCLEFTMMRTIGYGVIGLGFFGEKHAETAAALPNVDLRGVCTRNDQRRRLIKRRLKVPRDYRDYRELLADP